MRRTCLFPVFLLALMLLAAADRTGAALPSLEGKEPGFKFVVLGDNRTGGMDIYEVTETYKRIIGEINELRPVFVVLTGDIIRGGVNEEGLIREMWRRWMEATSVLEVPLFKVIGNHDVWSELSERVYREIFDEPLYYSFDYQGCHFVVLDTEVQGEAGKITGEQFGWLEEDLSRNQGARYTFVFLHRPIWGGLRGDPVAWAPVHRLFVAKGVDAVFAGHDHIYLADEIDGIHYIVTGGAGAPLYSAQEKTGGFFHYCLVSVEDQGLTIAVVKPGNIEPEDVVAVKGPGVRDQGGNQ